MPTIKQKKAFDKIVENHGNVSKSMIEVGYDETTAKNPKNLTESKGWQELLNERIKDEKLVDVLNEGLKADKKIYKNNKRTGELKEVGYDADYAVRHKYLETGLKLKSKFPTDKLELGTSESLSEVLLKINNILDG